jgi:diguanylate cyclase (GGDEF)-like protein/PAS domain S-box-containing protein
MRVRRFDQLKVEVDMQNPFVRTLARLSVGKKLLLIYLLDLTAVIFISSILINEKYIAINFARDELRGNAYIGVVRDALVDAALAGAGGGAPARAGLPQRALELAAAEREFGAEMSSTESNNALAASLEKLAAARGNEKDAVNDVLVRGRELVTRVGNQSKLILDPDLDSYYTMSLSVLRYPELVELMNGVGALLQRPGSDARTQYLILEGRLDATAKGIESDLAEALAAGGPLVKAALEDEHKKLAAAIETFRVSARRVIDRGRGAAALAEVDASQRDLLTQLRQTWKTSGQELDRLLEQRVDGLFSRMWLHLGTAAFLLAALLTMVFYVARQIALPLRRLASVTEKVRLTGDYTLRGQWKSEDEIGRLVLGFNDMLAQLDRDREVQQELAANSRAAEAQQALVEATPIPMVVTAVPGHEVLHANGPAKRWLEGIKSDPWAAGLEPSVRARFFAQLADQDAVDEFEVRWRAGAEPAWAVLSARRLQYQGQDAVLTAFSPINHLKLMEHRLELWAKVFEASSEGIMIVDAEERILTVNRAFVRAIGYDFHDVLGDRPEFLSPEGSDGQFFHGLLETAKKRGAWQGETKLCRRNGEEFPAWLMISAVRENEGGISYYICTAIDVTERKKSEERIQFLAHHDVLTELPNRSLCIERLRHALLQVPRSKLKVAVLFIDLDRFKTINDTLGHHIGDGLLRSVAARLVEAVRAGDTVSRLGGDEFVVVLNGVADSDEVTHIVERRLIPMIRDAHTVNGADLHVSCSVGIAMHPDDGADVDELMRHADAAMYQAKSQGRNSAQFFSAEMTARAERRMLLESSLRSAIERDELSLNYQPRVDARSGALVGVEALLRWHNPELGAVNPVQFIPIAEESGLIVPIGAWVMEEACAQMARWRAGPLGNIGVSLNLSPLQLRDRGLLETLQACLRRHAIRKGTLEIEITESALMESVEANLQILQAIRESGVGLAIDDFGTGYSSLNYLNRFPLDKLKIDRSFVHDMLDDPTDLAITRAIIGLGHTLGLRVVAEGVETRQEVDILCAEGCDEFQGYFYARPMPAAEFEAWAAARPPVAAATGGVVVDIKRA